MVYRFSWLAGIAAIGLALARAERLLRASVEGMPWEVVLIAAAVLGAAITWAGVSFRLSGTLIAAINTVAAVLAVVRVAVPTTTWYGLPTFDSISALQVEIQFARDVISTGSAPVIPLAGIVAILTAVFWGLGALLSWGIGRGQPYLAVLPPLVVYLEFAVMDRRPSGWWTVAFMFFIYAALLAVALDRRRQGTGHLTARRTKLALVRSLPSVAVITLVASLLVALLTANAVADLVPRSGYLDWRARSGLTGEYYGSVSYNPFVGIRQSLISPTDVPLFVASFEGDTALDHYWRLLALDTFDGQQWHIGAGAEIDRPDDVEAFDAEADSFFGPTEEIIQKVTILALQMDWLPTVYAPTGVTAPNEAVEQGYRVRKGDGAVRFDALTYRGMSYRVTSQIPQPDLDVLSRTAEGNPSIVFSGAAEAEVFEPADEIPVIEQRELTDVDRYLELPEDLDIRLRVLAFDTVEGLDTDFEKAVALEAFFRTPGNFVYSTDVVPGHGAQSVTAWLLEPSSESYRVGYCEQFSTSMALLARIVGIPSRVVLGFTPGVPLEDGRVVVRDRNAHAWVELWMPSQGWIRFDPTPRGDRVNPPTLDSLPFDVAQYLDVVEPEPIEFDSSPTGGPLLPRDDLLDIPEQIAAPDAAGEQRPGIAIPAWMPIAGAVLLVIFGLVPAMKWARRRIRLRRLESGDISAAWSEIVDRLSDLGDGPKPSATPREFAGAVDPALRPLAEIYGAAFYGEIRHEAPALATATRSLLDTEERLPTRYPLLRRLRARYRLRTLLPRRLRRRFRARAERKGSR